jgi:hypothetical protein
MIPQSRDDFKAYCLRALGAPVVQVNISDEQAEDRIDEALYVYQQYHMDGVVKNYLKHQITASTMVFSPVSTGTFTNGESFHGVTSGATGVVGSQANGNTLFFYTANGPAFANGETVVGGQSGATANVFSISLGDMDKEYFDIVDPTIVSVVSMFSPWDGRLSAGDILFDPQAQFNMSLLANFTSTSLVPYVMGRQYQQLMNDTLRGRPRIRFQRHQNRLYVDVLFRNTFFPGQWLVFEVYQALDPETFTDVWMDEWLQRYAIALLKRQWGQNLSKYTGIMLPGNVSFDGKTMYTEAVQEVKDLREEVKSTFSLPCDFMIG